LTATPLRTLSRRHSPPAERGRQWHESALFSVKEKRFDERLAWGCAWMGYALPTLGTFCIVPNENSVRRVAAAIVQSNARSARVRERGVPQVGFSATIWKIRSGHPSRAFSFRLGRAATQKELVNEAEFGLGMPALQRCELLPERQILQKEVLAWAKAANQCSEPKPKMVEHRTQS